MPEKSIDLKVADPEPTHVGRNIVTLDRETKRQLEITSGDIVEIAGPKKKTAAIVWPARAEDEGKLLVRMDNLIRHNAGVGIGEKVTVIKCVPKEAKKVVLAPTQEIRIIASGYDRILKKTFLGRPLTFGDNVWISVFGTGFVYKVIDTTPRGAVKVTDFTQIVLKEAPVKGEIETVPSVSYDDIGGLDEPIRKVREMIELPMRHPEIFRKLGIVPPKGVLLYGPPGTGKTLLAKAVAHETNAHFKSVNAPEIMSKFVGEAEERIRQIFKEAEENAPSIIFIDEIDAIAPKRETVMGEVERRVVAQILALMDGLEARGNVIVIAATNRVNSLDEALRRPGRFDREIEFPVPDKNARKDILLIHTRGMPLAKDVELDYFASITHGFVGADLAALGKEAAMKALRRYLPKFDLEAETIPQEILESLEVNKKDFQNGLKDVQPSALREVTIEIPNVKWSDVGDLENAKRDLKEAVEWPLKHPESFKQMGIKPPAGILLFGPPGCGKTLLAKAVASESEANFISIKGPELLSMWVGESEKGVRNIFKKARQVAPCIVFFDEIDALAPKRGLNFGSHVSETVVNQLLTELDGIEQNRGVIFMAATNRPDLIDPGLMRPGRIDKLVRIEAPSKEGRLEIFKVHTKNVMLDKDVSLEALVEKTGGFNGADIEGLIRTAALVALRKSAMKPVPITMKDFEKALSSASASITQKVEDSYTEFEKHIAEFKPTYVG
ncbi:MAG: CDC48 family AAA ATPase [archaeon]